jgi:hypothetical protein
MRKNKHSSQSLVLTSSSQLYALRRRMEESGITHGQSVLANINYVYISNGKISFWNMPALEILEHITPGDGGRIAQQVILRGPFRVRENIQRRTVEAIRTWYRENNDMFYILLLK